MAKHLMRDPETGKALAEKVQKNKLLKHFPGTCEVNSDPNRNVDLLAGFGSLRNNLRLVPSRKGWVAVMYEEKGMITFYVQLNAERAAWQHISWEKDFDKNWDNKKVREAIENFICVAECEDQK